MVQNSRIFTIFLSPIQRLAFGKLNNFEIFEVFFLFHLHSKVFITIDRYLSVRITAWRKLYFTTKKAKLLCLTIGFFIFLLNSHLIVLNGYIIELNQTKIVKCYTPKYLFDELSYIPRWHKVDLKMSYV